MRQSGGSSSQSLSGKEPWLAVNLSMFFPGIGQIYAGKVLKGWFFILSYIFLFCLGGWLIFSPKGDALIGLLCLLATVFLGIWSLFDAHSSAEKGNFSNFEELRKSSKDPWLAVFLSRIIPGIGHIYLNKTWLGILFILLFLVSALVPLLPIVFSAFVAYHAYVISPVRRERSKRLIVTISSLLIILGILYNLFPGFIEKFIVEGSYIASGAMLPTLQINDRLIIDKVSYHFQNPQRGDIVVFMVPDQASICFGGVSPQQPSDMTKQRNPKLKDPFIDRIIGLPGDKVAVKGRRVYINNQLLREEYIEEAPAYEFGPVTVPKNSYLVLGDNRNNSCDSHYWGYVPRENIIGKATKRFWPPKRSGAIK
jgi:signal peptidase I